MYETSEDLEECRLAGTVAPDDADMLAGSTVFAMFWMDRTFMEWILWERGYL